MSDAIRDRLAATLSGTHTIERELGGGGMARVFLATERSLGRQVVIKTLPDEAWTPATAQRFHREILTAAQLQHANIVPVLSAGETDGLPYFLMPWVDGASLRERMARGPVPLQEAVAILRDVARALAAAHARNVVHRDIKPENILLSAGAAVVTDFGVAKAITLATQGSMTSSAMTAVGTTLGTLAYMAPEQIAGDPSLDHRADLYAWGMVAYELLAGQRPFADLANVALTQAQMVKMPEPLGKLAPTVPPALAQLVMQCLAKEASKRPADATALLAVLDSPSGEALAAMQPSAKGRWIAAAVVVVAGIAGWLTLGRGPATDERVIAVAPFRVGGAAPDAQYLREGLADLMVPQLAVLPELSTASMRVVLDRWKRTAGSADADLDDAGALRVARDAGAGQLILGDLIGTADRLTVSARLLRSRDGKELAQTQVTGSSDSLAVLATRVVTALMSVRDGVTTERIRSVLSASSAAIAPYLRGEQLFRRGRYADARNAFHEAWQADSTMAIAALRISFTNGWTLNNILPGPWLQRAWAHRDRLVGTDSLLLISQLGINYPEPTPRRAHVAALERMAQRANSAELWYAYGDLVVHNGMMLGIDDFWERALDAFRRAEAIDSSFIGALEHQPQGYATLGDIAAARAALQRQARVDSLGDWYPVSQVVVEFADGTVPEQMQALRRAAVKRPVIVQGFGLDLAASDGGYNWPPNLVLLDSIDAFARATLSPDAYRNQFGAGLQYALRNTGQLKRLRAMGSPPAYMSDFATNFPAEHGEAIAAALFWGDDSLAAQRAATRLESELPRLDAASRIEAQALLGLWAIAQRDTPAAQQRLRELETSAGNSSDAALRQRAGALAAAVQLPLAVERGDNDLAARLALADSLLIDVPGISRESRTIGNFVLATAYERAGRSQDALRVMRRRDYQLAYAFLASERLYRIGQLAEETGNVDEAISALRNFVAMRERADPQFQPQVQQARDRLARLERRAKR